MKTASVATVQQIFRDQGVNGWLELRRRYGCSFWLQGGVISSDPDVVRQVLMERPHVENRAGPYKLMEKIVPGAPGILFKDGQEWATRLRLLMPSFTASRIDALAGEMVEAATTHLSTIPENEALPDLARTISELGGRTVMQAGYNLQPDHPLARRFAEELIAYKFATMTDDDRRRLDEVGFHWTKLRHLPWAIAHNFELRARIGRLRSIVDQIVADMPLFDASRKGWIQMLVEGGIEGKALVDELNHLYGAYNAVDYVITCALVEMARHPDIAEEVRAELRTHVAEGGHFKLDTLDALPRTHGFILEVLRCYPVAMLIFRETGAAMTVTDEAVPEKTIVMVPIFSLHHDPEQWDSPGDFRPSRWLEGDTRSERYSYVPFLDGPRKCIGQRLANMQMLAALVALRHHRVEIKADDLEVNRYVVPRWDGPIPFRLVRDRADG